MSETTPEAPESRFEPLVRELEDLVARLERGDLELEQALQAFERGMALAKRAGAILDRAEQRVEQLIEARDGSAREVPFDDAPPRSQ